MRNEMRNETRSEGMGSSGRRIVRTHSEASAVRTDGLAPATIPVRAARFVADRGRLCTIALDGSWGVALRAAGLAIDAALDSARPDRRGWLVVELSSADARASAQECTNEAEAIMCNLGRAGYGEGPDDALVMVGVLHVARASLEACADRCDRERAAGDWLREGRI